MLIQVRIWDQETDALRDATIEVDRTDHDELAMHVRPLEGHDGDPRPSIYFPRDAAGALFGALGVLAAGEKRLTT